MYLVPCVSEVSASHQKHYSFLLVILFIVQDSKNTEEEHNISATESVFRPRYKGLELSTPLC